MNTRDPILKTIDIDDLRPTQMTVGYREVDEKRRQWKERSDAGAGKFLGSHMIPTVLGPRSHHYVLDHHHLAMALQQAEQKQVLVTVLVDLSGLGKASFWTFLDNRAWCHPYDAAGRRHDFDDIPRRVCDLADDPYRSLAGELRRAGGFAKDTTPFSEFLWADFLRTRVKTRQIKDRFSAALEKAMSLAKSEEAGYLPGWCGPHPE